MASRRQVLDALTEPGSVASIAQRVGCSMSEAKRHLSMLEARGTITHHEENGTLVYTRRGGR